jgi:virulence factor Mce-like protein
MKHRWCAVLAAAGVVATSCASINVNALPQPGNSYRDGYDIVVEFDNTLNLPQRAKVVLDGTTVGVVTNVSVTSRQVNVTARIDPEVVIPSNVHADLQQATVLGDIYLALDRLQNNNSLAPPLGPGGRVPLANTTSPPQLEDTIASLANFVASGSIQRVQNTIIGLNRVTPPQDDVRRISSQVTADLADLANNIELVDKWLDSVTETVGVMHNRLPVYNWMFSPDGMTEMLRADQIGYYIAIAVPSLGSVYSGGYWLVPLLRSLADAVGALRDSKWAFEEEYPAWQRLLLDYFLPQDKYPAVNITSIVGPDGRELSGNVQDILRILGAAP